MTSRDIIIEAERLWAERGWHDEDPRAQYLLGLIFHHHVPTGVLTGVEAVIPALAALIAGYLAPHTSRPAVAK